MYTYVIPSNTYGALTSNRLPYKSASSVCQYYIDLRNEISWPNVLGNVVVSNVIADYASAGSLTIASLGSNGTVAGFLISNGTDAVNYRIDFVAPVLNPSNVAVETYFVQVVLPVGYSTSAYDKLILQGDINGIGLGVIQTSLSASAAGNIANAIGNSITNVAYANAAGYANIALYYPVTSVNGQTGNVVVQAGNTIVTLIGDVTGNGLTNSNITTTLANTGVVAGTYGSATQVAEHVVDSKGRIISAANVTISFPSTVNYANLAGTANVALSGWTYPVTSVNGMTGNVVITNVTSVAFANVAGYANFAGSANTATTANVALSGWTYPVTSVNGQTGTVVISNVAVANYANFSGSATTATTANVALSGWTYPVTSVNGQTGAVVISNVAVANYANFAGSANISTYANTAGSANTATTANVALSGWTYPVTSVNGQTGAVVISNVAVASFANASAVANTVNTITSSQITTALGYVPLSNTSNIVITGDVIGSGNSTNIVATLATIGSLGTYSLATVTVDAKGRVIAASSGTGGGGGTYVPASGGTFTGQVSMTANAVIQNTLTLTSPVNTFSQIVLQNSGSTRWTIGLANAEHGSNSGSDLVFTAYADNGTSPLIAQYTFQRNNQWFNTGNSAQFQGSLQVEANGTSGGAGSTIQLLNNGNAGPANIQLSVSGFSGSTSVPAITSYKTTGGSLGLPMWSIVMGSYTASFSTLTNFQIGCVTANASTTFTYPLTIAPSGLMTLTSNLAVTNAVVISSPATNTNADIWFQNTGINRWSIGTGNQESGNNSGSDLQIASFSDNGVTQINTMTVYRSNGSIMMAPSGQIMMTTQQGTGATYFSNSALNINYNGTVAISMFGAPAYITLNTSNYTSGGNGLLLISDYRNSSGNQIQGNKSAGSGNGYTNWLLTLGDNSNVNYKGNFTLQRYSGAFSSSLTDQPLTIFTANGAALWLNPVFFNNGINLNYSAGSTTRTVTYQTNAATRVVTGLTNVLETGNSVGSDYIIQVWNDGANTATNAVTIYRANGNVVFANAIIQPTPPQYDNGANSVNAAWVNEQGFMPSYNIYQGTGNFNQVINTPAQPSYLINAVGSYSASLTLNNSGYYNGIGGNNLIVGAVTPGTSLLTTRPNWAISLGDSYNHVNANYQGFFYIARFTGTSQNTFNYFTINNGGSNNSYADSPLLINIANGFVQLQNLTFFNNGINITGAAASTVRQVTYSNSVANFNLYNYNQQPSGGVGGSAPTNNRVTHGLTSTAETGNNVGSDFVITTWNDSGTVATNAVTIYRANASVVFANAITANVISVSSYYVSPANSAIIHIPAGTSTALIDPIGTITSPVIYIPSGYVASGYSQKLQLFFTNAITSVSWLGSFINPAAQSPPTSLSSGQMIEFDYFPIANAWFIVNSI